MNDDKEEDEEVNLLSEVRVVDHEKRSYEVAGRFVLTNSVKLKVPDTVTKITVSTLEAVRILHGDTEMLREILRSVHFVLDTGNLVNGGEKEILT